ncbi:MAG: hypothetical protein Ct9H300mP10_00160 [Methanobacteriota archaeon]|nr:MAG: hypothetical protein Ct9H300mP10_00160 [Euryarchaeota archaeon]
MDEQRRIRALMEKDPVRFFERENIGLWDDARRALWEFVNADVDGMVFVSNATQGINTVLRSLRLQPGDEIIVPDHSYQACWNAVDFVTEGRGEDGGGRGPLQGRGSAGGA